MRSNYDRTSSQLFDIGDTLIDNPNDHEITQIQGPNKTTKVIKKTIHKYNISNIDDIDGEIIALIFNKIQTGSQIIKELNITKMRTFATNRRIWVHKETWDIIKYLLFSGNLVDIKDGMYILGEMVKIAKLKNITFVSKKCRRTILFQVIGFSDLLNDKSVSHDALNVLEIILESNGICISGVTNNDVTFTILSGEIDDIFAILIA